MRLDNYLVEKSLAGSRTKAQAIIKDGLVSVNEKVILKSAFKVEDEDRVLVKAAGAWQDIIGWNNVASTYDDTSPDGVDRFGDKELEKMGWHGTDFNIDYRDIVNELEAKVEGVILCIEHLEPNYQFSGLGYVSNMPQARTVMFDFCKAHIKALLEGESEFTVDNLDDDEQEAAEYFKLI